MNTYGLLITAGGTQYSFHLDTLASVVDCISKSSDVTDYTVTRQTHDHNSIVSFETVSDKEIVLEMCKLSQVVLA